MIENLFSLTGKVAVVTGAGSGIGRATAQLLDRLGAVVIATDVNEKTVAETAASFRGTGRSLRHDVTSEDDWTKVGSDVERTNGRLDILVNNAGIMTNCLFTETSLETFRRQHRINVESVFIGMQTAIPLMKKTLDRRDAKTCSIVNVSSIYGQVVGECFSAYSASKGAVRLLTKAVANELGTTGIRANTIHPGGIQTNLAADWEPAKDSTGKPIPPEQIAAHFLSLIPMGRIGEAPEVASMIAFLASDAASYVTGAEFVVDGGFTIR